LVYMDASGGSSKSKATQTAIILNIGGSNLIKTVDQIEFEKEEHGTDPTKVLQKIEESMYCSSQQNEVLQMFKFWNIANMEPFDSFVRELRRKAESCNFLEKDRMIRDKIVFSAGPKLQQQLVSENQLTLKKVITLCRAYEASTNHAHEMKGRGNEQNIDKVHVDMMQSKKASRSLTSAEQNWAQIEKEALAVVYGLERFDQYTYGRKVIVENDHKPLFSIFRKPVSQAPKRLQALMLCLHRYDVELAGKDLLITDTLSRAYIKCLDETVRVMNMNLLPEIPDKMLERVKEETSKDESLVLLWETIQVGWPEKKADTLPAVLTYYDIRDTLSGQDGVLVKGQRIIVPKALRKEMLQKLHAAHLGFDSMMRRAKEVIYWPAMQNNIKQKADTCKVCQELKPKNQKETLQQVDDGEYPWDRIGMDLFVIEGKWYLVIVDYFSGYIEVEFLPTQTSHQVIVKLKMHCARYGIPRSIISDNGMQFASRELQTFTTKWAIKHTFSSPHHQQTVVPKPL
jgi:hypothetical protein